MLHAHERIAGPVEHERRNADARQHVADVERVEHPTHSDDRARTGAQALIPRPPLAERLVADLARSDDIEKHTASPTGAHHVQGLVLHSGCAAPFIVRGLRKAREAVHEHEARSSLWIRRGEQHGERASAAHADEHGPLRADLVHHDADVVEPLLERGHLVRWDGIRNARSALIKRDQSPERAEARKEFRKRRSVPLRLDRVPELRDEHEIRLAFAGDLVRDVDVPAFGVSCLWQHRDRILALLCARRQGTPAEARAIGRRRCRRRAIR